MTHEQGTCRALCCWPCKSVTSQLAHMQRHQNLLPVAPGSCLTLLVRSASKPRDSNRVCAMSHAACGGHAELARLLKPAVGTCDHLRYMPCLAADVWRRMQPGKCAGLPAADLTCLRQACCVPAFAERASLLHSALTSRKRKTPEACSSEEGDAETQQA
jgi:hypothetical protein